MDYNKNWEKITNDFSTKVKKITDKYLISKSTNQNNISHIENEGIFQYFLKNKILTTISLLIISFIVLSILLFLSKPKFLIDEVKDEKTFFIEKKIKIKMLLSISLFLSLISAFIFYKYF